MALKYGFYDAKYDANTGTYDRTYDAETMSSLFDGIINDGVFVKYKSAFKVTGVSTKSNTVQVGTGRCWFDHTWTSNEYPFEITLTDPPKVSANSRYDALYLKVDKGDRINSIISVEGTETSGTPSYPPPSSTAVEMQTEDLRTYWMDGDDIYYHRFAVIKRTVNNTDLTNSEIEMTYDVCTLNDESVSLEDMFQRWWNTLVKEVTQTAIESRYYTCISVTKTSKSAKVAYCDDYIFTQKPGVAIKVIFQNDCSTSSGEHTLCVNNTGAYPICYNYWKTDGTRDTNLDSEAWLAGDIVTFIFDGTYWIMMDDWRKNGGGGIYYGKCTTASDTTTKVVSLDDASFTLQEGAQVIVTFSNTNTADSPKMNVAGTGAASMVYRGVTVSTSVSGTEVTKTYSNAYVAVPHEPWTPGASVLFEYIDSKWVQIIPDYAKGYQALAEDRSMALGYRNVISNSSSNSVDGSAVLGGQNNIILQNSSQSQSSMENSGIVLASNGRVINSGKGNHILGGTDGAISKAGNYNTLIGGRGLQINSSGVNNMTAMGRYNTGNPYDFVIGDGTSDSNRSDVFWIDDGVVYARDFAVTRTMKMANVELYVCPDGEGSTSNGLNKVGLTIGDKHTISGIGSYTMLQVQPEGHAIMIPLTRLYESSSNNNRQFHGSTCFVNQDTLSSGKYRITVFTFVCDLILSSFNSDEFYYEGCVEYDVQFTSSSKYGTSGLTYSSTNGQKSSRIVRIYGVY